MDLSRLKFFVKVYLVGTARAVLLRFFGAKPNTNQWDKRMLLVNFDGLGDIVLMNGVIKHYKKDFPDREIYLAVRGGIGAERSLFGDFIDEIIYFDADRFKKNPWYGVRFINELRRIGFATVVNHDPSVGEALGKEVAARLGARDVIGYEGLGIQFARPFDANMEMGIQFVERHIFPRYTKIIPSIDRHADVNKRLTNFLRHYITIYEAVSGSRQKDYSSTVAVSPESDQSVLAMLAEYGVKSGEYCLLTLGTSTPHRDWPAERFAEVMNAAKGLKVVLVGARSDAPLRDRFKARYAGSFVDLVGKTSIPQVVALAKHSLLVFSNDTAPTHIAIALKKPSLAILGLGHFGMLSLYGYEDVNHWVYSKTAQCLCDNWRCIHTVGPAEPSPCVGSVLVADVIKEFASLVDYIKKNPNCPRTAFSVEFKHL